VLCSYFGTIAAQCEGNTPASCVRTWEISTGSIGSLHGVAQQQVSYRFAKQATALDDDRSPFCSPVGQTRRKRLFDSDTHQTQTVICLIQLTKALCRKVRRHSVQDVERTQNQRYCKHSSHRSRSGTTLPLMDTRA
jgi:hypothetical protein